MKGMQNNENKVVKRKILSGKSNAIFVFQVCQKSNYLSKGKKKHVFYLPN